jgi:zinc protease
MEARSSVEWLMKRRWNSAITINVEETNAKIQKYIHDDNRTIVFTGPTTEKTNLLKKKF